MGDIYNMVDFPYISWSQSVIPMVIQYSTQVIIIIIIIIIITPHSFCRILNAQFGEAKVLKGHPWVLPNAISNSEAEFLNDKIWCIEDDSVQKVVASKLPFFF